MAATGPVNGGRGRGHQPCPLVLQRYMGGGGHCWPLNQPCWHGQRGRERHWQMAGDRGHRGWALEPRSQPAALPYGSAPRSWVGGGRERWTQRQRGCVAGRQRKIETNRVSWRQTEEEDGEEKRTGETIKEWKIKKWEKLSISRAMVEGLVEKERNTI